MPLRSSRPIPVVLALALGACRSGFVTLPPDEVEIATAPPGTPTEPARAAPPPVPVPATMTFDEAWAWLREQLPEATANLRPAGDDRRLDELLSWAAPDGTITLYDRACRKLALTRNERSLDGDIHVKEIVRGNTRTVSGESISFGWTITVLCGFDNEYQRTETGAWQETASSATGCATTVGHNLSEVTGTEVWYGGAALQLSAVCVMRHEKTQRCLDGSQQTCSSCERLGLEIESSDLHHRTTTAVGATRMFAGPEPVDCPACPADERTTKLAAVNAALKGAALERVDLERHPTLFRTRAACRAYRKRHKISASERSLW